MMHIVYTKHTKVHKLTRKPHQNTRVYCVRECVSVQFGSFLSGPGGGVTPSQPEGSHPRAGSGAGSQAVGGTLCFDFVLQGSN